MSRFLSGPIVTAAQMRAAEEAVMANGADVHALMARAGAAVARAVWRYGGGQATLIVCGPGNNGGDGYVAARLLKEWGLDVAVCALREPRTPAARAACALWPEPVLAWGQSKAAPILVDALFGTGLQRALETDISQELARLAAAAHLVVAVDLPSGVGCDDGALLGAPPAHVTIALGALKPAHLLQPAAGLCGQVRVADIGIPVPHVVKVLSKPHLQQPSTDSHKYTRGYALVMGGQLAGAALLSARAAMRLAGYVALSGARRAGPDALVHRRAGDALADERLGAALIGPGLGRDAKALDLLDTALATDHRLVLDADALMLLDVHRLAALKDRTHTAILTPHEGEFRTLFGIRPGSKIDRATAAAALSGAVIIFKGSDTVIASPDGRVRLSPALPGWLASAGTGDVLGGITLALRAGGMDAFDAACGAVWLHGEAARLAGPALIADDLPRHLPAALEACL